MTPGLRPLMLAQARTCREGAVGSREAMGAAGSWCWHLGPCEIELKPPSTHA